MAQPHQHPERRAVLRAADVDRQRVAEQLRHAHAEGRLDLGEFDERVAAAWAARTYGDLDALVADLPPVPAALVPAARPHPPARPAGPDGAAVAAWAGAGVLNLVIWGIVAVSVGEWIYPWWIWVVGPWGVLLLARWIGAHRGAPGS